MGAVCKSELIKQVAGRLPDYSVKEIEIIINSSLTIFSNSLSQGNRIEMRGLLGSLEPRDYPPHVARNPKTGEKVMTTGTRSVNFTPAKKLKEAVNESRDYTVIREEE